MIPQPITLDGRSGTVVYLDAAWHPVTPEQAVAARVLFDDGGTAFFTVQSIAEKYDPAQPRGKGGRWVKGPTMDVGGGVSYTDTLAYEGGYGPRARRIGLVLDGREVGHAEYYPDFHNSKLAHLEFLGIADKTVRGKGHGERFYRHVVDKLKTEGFTKVIGEVTSAAILRLGTKIMGRPESLGDAIEHVAYEDALKRLSPLAPENEQGVIDTWNHLTAIWSLAKTHAGVGGLTQKFDEAQHPRGDDGRFVEATAPRIFNRPEDVGQYDSWGEKKWGWRITPEEAKQYGGKVGDVSGKLLTGEPLTREQLPETLYHVTTNAQAVESSGVLLGLLESGGLGGGQAKGVSFTTSAEDARVIQRELRRAVQIARGDLDIDALERWAAEDEQEVGLPKGSLSSAVQYARDFYEGNVHTLRGEFVSDPTGEYKDENRGKTFGHIGVRAPEEQERVRRSLIKDTLNAYLQVRGHTEDTAGTRIELLKNPILFSNQELLARISPEAVRTLTVPSAQIPAGALVTTGSDTFLHEVRAYSDVPLRRQSIAKFDESQHPREPKGTTIGGQFASSESGTVRQSSPILVAQAKAGIAAVEKLLPEAIVSADFSKTQVGSAAAHTWKEIDPAVQDQIREKYLDREGEHPDRVEKRLARWNQMSEDEKYLMADHLQVWPKPAEKDWTQYYPEQWTTGVETGTHTDEDYGRTHAIAKSLTELRTDQLREERGLLGQIPTYTIVKPDYFNEKHPSYLIKNAAGLTIGSSNTPEQAKANAEEWAHSAAAIPSEQLIDTVWKGWKSSSSSGIGLSLQLAAAREFGGHDRMTPDEVDEAKLTASSYGGIETLQAYVRAQWEVSQMIMQKAGEDHVAVYRAVMLPSKTLRHTDNQVTDKLGGDLPVTNVVTETRDGKQVVSFRFNGVQFSEPRRYALQTNRPGESILDLPIGKKPPERKLEPESDTLERWQERTLVNVLGYPSDSIFVKLPNLVVQKAGAQSTTGTRSVANDWAGIGPTPAESERVVLRIEAPSTSVLSLPVYGENVAEEHESVLMGTRDKWLWDAWRGRAPDFASQGVARKAETVPLVIDLQEADRGKPHWLSGMTAAKWDEAKVHRNPAGAPNSTGGQFARSDTAMGLGWSTAPGMERHAPGEIDVVLDPPHGTGFENNPRGVDLPGPPPPEPVPRVPIGAPSASQALAEGQVQTVDRKLTGGVNQVYRVTLDDDQSTRAIFKPESGEQWEASFANRDISNYIDNKQFSLAEREAVAYEVSASLGFGELVPETRLRTELDLPGVEDAQSDEEDGGGYDEDYAREQYDEYKQKFFEQDHDSVYDQVSQEMERLYQEARDEHASDIEHRTDEMTDIWNEVIKDFPDDSAYGDPEALHEHPNLPLGSQQPFEPKPLLGVLDPIEVLDEAKVDVSAKMSDEEKQRVEQVLRDKLKEGYQELGDVDPEVAKDHLDRDEWFQAHEDTEMQFRDSRLMSKLQSFDSWRHSQGMYSNDEGGGPRRQVNQDAPHPQGGSLQRYVQGLDGYGEASYENKTRMAVLDYAIGTMDRHPNNLMYYGDIPVAIDNGYSFPASPTPDGFTFRSAAVNDWLRDPAHHHVPEALRAPMLAEVSKAEMWQSLVDRHPNMSELERNAFLGRIENLKEALSYDEGLSTLWHDQHLMGRPYGS